MTEAEIAEIREQLQHACPECQGHWECDDMRALLAHIDALAAQGIALIAHRDALAAEVERLKGDNNDLNQRLGQATINVMEQAEKIASTTIYPRLNADIDSLRDLVREARQLISPSHPTAVWWLERAAKV